MPVRRPKKCRARGCQTPADPDIESFDGYCEECAAEYLDGHQDQIDYDAWASGEFE